MLLPTGRLRVLSWVGTSIIEPARRAASPQAEVVELPDLLCTCWLPAGNARKQLLKDCVLCMAMLGIHVHAGSLPAHTMAVQPHSSASREVTISAG